MNTSSPSRRFPTSRDHGFLPALVGVAALAACTTLPKVKQSWYAFPKEVAFIEEVKRPYDSLGTVRAKVNFPTLDPVNDENKLCRNYYNKAVADLVKSARKKGADAVIEIRSVVFLEDGQQEIHKTPECADDGEEGQILAQGIAVKWKPEPSPSPSMIPGSTF